MNNQYLLVRMCLLSAVCLPVSAALADELPMNGIDASVTGSVGFRNISASEFVFSGQTLLNRLDWHVSNAVTVKSEAIANLSRNWTLKAEFSAAFAGDGEEVSRGYDGGYSSQSGPDTWDSKFYSPVTKLDYFLQGGIEADRTLYETDDLLISAGPGIKYTDFQMTSWGGEYIYSSSALRDSMDIYFSDTKNVTYRQQIPVGFLGLNVDKTLGGLTLSGSVQAGAAIRFQDTDDHYLTDMHYEDSMGIAPYVGLGAKANYNVNENTSLFASVNYETVLRTRGDLNAYDNSTGTLTQTPGIVATSMQTWAVSAGVKVRF